MNIGKEIIEVENRIPYQLAGAVIRNIAATIDLVKRSAFGFQEIFVYEQVVFGAAFAQGINVRMLAENEVIGRDFFLVRG